MDIVITKVKKASFTRPESTAYLLSYIVRRSRLLNIVGLAFWSFDFDLLLLPNIY